MKVFLQLSWFFKQEKSIHNGDCPLTDGSFFTACTTENYWHCRR